MEFIEDVKRLESLEKKKMWKELVLPYKKLLRHYVETKDDGGTNKVLKRLLFCARMTDDRDVIVEYVIDMYKENTTKNSVWQGAIMEEVFYYEKEYAKSIMVGEFELRELIVKLYYVMIAVNLVNLGDIKNKKICSAKERIRTELSYFADRVFALQLDSNKESGFSGIEDQSEYENFLKKLVERLSLSEYPHLDGEEMKQLVAFCIDKEILKNLLSKRLPDWDCVGLFEDEMKGMLYRLLTMDLSIENVGQIDDLLSIYNEECMEYSSFRGGLEDYHLFCTKYQNILKCVKLCTDKDDVSDIGREYVGSIFKDLVDACNVIRMPVFPISIAYFCMYVLEACRRPIENMHIGSDDKVFRESSAELGKINRLLFDIFSCCVNNISKHACLYTKESVLFVIEKYLEYGHLSKSVGNVDSKEFECVFQFVLTKELNDKNMRICMFSMEILLEKQCSISQSTLLKLLARYGSNISFYVTAAYAFYRQRYYETAYMFFNKIVTVEFDCDGNKNGLVLKDPNHEDAGYVYYLFGIVYWQYSICKEKNGNIPFLDFENETYRVPESNTTKNIVLRAFVEAYKRTKTIKHAQVLACTLEKIGTYFLILGKTLNTSVSFYHNSDHNSMIDDLKYEVNTNGYLERAKELYQRVLFLNPFSHHTLYLMLNLLIDVVNATKKVLENYERSLVDESVEDLETKEVHIRDLIRMIHNRLLDLENNMENLNSTDRFLLYRGLGKIYSFIEIDNEKALRYFQMCVRMVENDIVSLYYVGRIYYIGDKFILSHNIFTKITEILETLYGPLPNVYDNSLGNVNQDVVNTVKSGLLAKLYLSKICDRLYRFGDSLTYCDKLIRDVGFLKSWDALGGEKNKGGKIDFYPSLDFAYIETIVNIRKMNIYSNLFKHAVFSNDTKGQCVFSRKIVDVALNAIGSNGDEIFEMFSKNLFFFQFIPRSTLDPGVLEEEKFCGVADKLVDDTTCLPKCLVDTLKTILKNMRHCYFVLWKLGIYSCIIALYENAKSFSRISEILVKMSYFLILICNDSQEQNKPLKDLILTVLKMSVQCCPSSYIPWNALGVFLFVFDIDVGFSFVCFKNSLNLVCGDGNGEIDVKLNILSAILFRSVTAGCDTNLSLISLLRDRFDTLRLLDTENIYSVLSISIITEYLVFNSNICPAISKSTGDVDVLSLSRNNEAVCSEESKVVFLFSHYEEKLYYIENVFLNHFISIKYAYYLLKLLHFKRRHFKDHIVNLNRSVNSVSRCVAVNEIDCTLESFKTSMIYGMLLDASQLYDNAYMFYRKLLSRCTFEGNTSGRVGHKQYLMLKMRMLRLLNIDRFGSPVEDDIISSLNGYICSEDKEVLPYIVLVRFHMGFSLFKNKNMQESLEEYKRVLVYSKKLISEHPNLIVATQIAVCKLLVQEEINVLIGKREKSLIQGYLDLVEGQLGGYIGQYPEYESLLCIYLVNRFIFGLNIFEKSISSTGLQEIERPFGDYRRLLSLGGSEKFNLVLFYICLIADSEMALSYVSSFSHKEPYDIKYKVLLSLAIVATGKNIDVMDGIPVTSGDVMEIEELEDFILFDMYRAKVLSSIRHGLDFRRYLSIAVLLSPYGRGREFVDIFHNLQVA